MVVSLALKTTLGTGRPEISVVGRFSRDAIHPGKINPAPRLLTENNRHAAIPLATI